MASLVTHAYQITKPVLRGLTRIWGAECHSRFIFSIPTSTSSRQTLVQWVMSMEKDSTKTLRRWRATIKANGTPARWETSAGCSCVTSRRQNTPDLLRKHTLTVCGTMNCVIVSSKYIDSISVLYLSCFIYYKLLQLLKYAHIFSVYTKMRLFKSQKTRCDRAKLFISLK